MHTNGSILSPDTIRFERMLRGPIERVWAYLTESDKRGKWLARGEMELVEGGMVTLQFHHSDLSPVVEQIPEQFKDMEQGHQHVGRMLRIEPPHLLSFTWEDDSEVTFELEEKDGQVLLVLTHRKLTGDKAIRAGVLGGWHTHLDVLIDNLNGETPPGFWSRYLSLEKKYSAIV